MLKFSFVSLYSLHFTYGGNHGARIVWIQQFFSACWILCLVDVKIVIIKEIV